VTQLPEKASRMLSRRNGPPFAVSMAARTSSRRIALLRFKPDLLGNAVSAQSPMLGFP